MLDVKLLIPFCFIAIANIAQAQFDVQQYDSLVIDYNNYLSDTYYRYIFSRSQIEIHGEKTFYKRVIVDSSIWKFSYYADVRNDNRCIRMSDAYIDSLQVLISGLKTYVSSSSYMYIDAIAETDNLVIVFSEHKRSEKYEWSMILCTDCEHIQYINRIVNFLESLQHQ